MLIQKLRETILKIPIIRFEELFQYPFIERSSKLLKRKVWRQHQKRASSILFILIIKLQTWYNVSKIEQFKNQLLKIFTEWQKLKKLTMLMLLSTLYFWETTMMGDMENGITIQDWKDKIPVHMSRSQRMIFSFNL